MANWWNTWYGIIWGTYTVKVDTKRNDVGSWPVGKKSFANQATDGDLVVINVEIRSINHDLEQFDRETR